jgi:predicted NAD-dependent protein-ADP-ribosyltransferase YbiA (DUF1768 family)
MANKHTDRLCFYSKSYDYTPGKGANEYVSNNDKYQELSHVKDWRKVLSNFHEFPFEYDGNLYKSIEHAFQGAKFQLFDKKIGKLFVLGNEIGDLSALDARKNRKRIVLDDNQIQMWNEVSDHKMYEISLAKYKQCLLSQKILKMTIDAELWHYQVRQRPIRFIHLEKIRIMFI